MSGFKDALIAARARQQQAAVIVEVSRSEATDVVVRRAVRPVQIDLNQDKVAATRVIRTAARRVINQHRDEIEALAYK